ncbi:MAG: tRNA (guanosine(37)-N1)-methyltransferase TrmD, partial [Akkermansiaceae bacterium]
FEKKLQTSINKLQSPPVHIDIITLFPEIALAPLSESIMKRARENGVATVKAHQLRDWATGKHRKTDEYLCGGGQGMLLKPEPIFAAVEELRREYSKVLLMTPQGKPFKQADARRFSGQQHLIILCGHYEGVDHRVIEALVDEEISIGDYVLTNGAIAAAVVTDAIVRLLPGALGDARSPEDESFTDPTMLEAPAYTKPNTFQGMAVPEVLLSGDHGKIAKWKQEKALERTRQNRPDLLGE